MGFVVTWIRQLETLTLVNILNVNRVYINNITRRMVTVVHIKCICEKYEIAAKLRGESSWPVKGNFGRRECTGNFSLRSKRTFAVPRLDVYRWCGAACAGRCGCRVSCVAVKFGCGARPLDGVSCLVAERYCWVAAVASNLAIIS